MAKLNGVSVYVNPGRKPGHRFFSGERELSRLRVIDEVWFSLSNAWDHGSGSDAVNDYWHQARDLRAAGVRVANLQGRQVTRTIFGTS